MATCQPAGSLDVLLFFSLSWRSNHKVTREERSAFLPFPPGLCSLLGGVVALRLCVRYTNAELETCRARCKEGIMGDSVLVIGSGPTGLIVTHELLRRGIPCRLIDKRETPAGSTRAFTVHART